METKQWWKWEIQPKQKWYQIGLRELYYNRGLVTRLVRRDLLVNHQQTILGPLWLLLQPLLSTIIYVIIFNQIAKISTDGIKPILFYLSGVIIWTYFSDCLLGCMYTFRSNEQIFNKVYFPRLVVPISVIITQTIRLLIQMVLLFIIYFYFYYNNEISGIGTAGYFLPFLILLTALFAFGTGLTLSIFTVRYRDLDTIITFVLRVLMFATPVFYPSSIIPEKYKFWTWLNPLVTIIRVFRQSFRTNNQLNLHYLFATSIIIFALVIIGILLFKRQEIKVMDVI